MKESRFRFYRAGGVDQVQITTGRELVAIEHLDQKLWVALSCPVKGLEFDERTLALIDSDGDGRVRAPELIAAVRWAAGLLVDVEEFARSSPDLPLDVIDTRSDEGKLVLETARSLLSALGKGDATSITIDDTKIAREAFDKEAENGDGIVPAAAFGGDEPTSRAERILATLTNPKMDRAGAPGLDRENVTKFFESARAFVAWHEAGRVDEARPLGPVTSEAYDAFVAVRPKLDDFFARARVAAFDDRALVSLNRPDAAFEPLATTLLGETAPELESFPLARVAPGASLPLRRGLNPAWAARIATFEERVVRPIFGERESLSEADLHHLVNKFGAHAAWRAAQPEGPLGSWSEAELREFVEGDLEERLLAVVGRDEAAAPRANAIELVEKLVRYTRDLLTLANNFVSFRDFYDRSKKAIFQVGTLYIDQRAAELCVLVNDAARHATLAPLSRTYLLYCDLKNPHGKTMQIAAAITNGDVDNLMVGRNGLFYDRSGKDWDATVTRIVESPISIRQAFWYPYKKLIRLVEEQINKRAAAAQAEADANVTAGAASVDSATKGEVKAVAPPPKKLDIGVVAALGVAVGGITAALGAILGAFFGLGIWMPLGLLGLLLVISGPSMAIAWLKLRQRNIGPILDANGWAVNVLTKVNVPLGRSLTSIATLPHGATRDLVDPFAEKKKPWWLYVFFLILIGAGALWYLGKTDRFLPDRYRSVTVLGDAAPARVRVQPSVEPGAPKKP